MQLNLSDKCPSSLLRNIGEFFLDSSKVLEASSEASNKTVTRGHKSQDQPRDHEPEEENEEQIQGLLERANSLQKSMKSRGSANDSSTKNQDDTVLITVCAMQEGRPGVFSRKKSPYVEVQTKKTEGYDAFALKAARSCRVSVQRGQKLALFKMNGARILSENVTVKGKEKPWTIGSYLLMIKKSANSLKIGVGCIDEDPTDEDTSNEETSVLSPKRTGYDIEESWFSLRVEYFQPSRARPHSVRSHVTRQYIWRCILGKDFTQLGVYHPEEDGYQVYSISLNNSQLLSPLNDAQCNFAGYVVKDATSELKIMWQSPTAITVHSMKQPLILYCIASLHGICTYQWEIIGERDSTQHFPSSPVVYINKGGLYQCKALCNSDVVVGKIIRVIVDASTVDSDSEPSVISQPKKRFKGIEYVEETVTKHSVIANNGPCSFQSQRKKCSGERHLSGAASDDTIDLPVLPQFRSNQLPRNDTRSKDLVPVANSGDQDVLLGSNLMTDHSEDASVAITEGNLNPAAPEQSGDKANGTNDLPIYVPEFSEEDIVQASQGFSTKLGEGGFGHVYLGTMKGTKVAIKKFTDTIAVAHAAQLGMHIPEKFTTGGQLNCEAWALTRCRHKNLVELMGYCSKPPMLIYEFMEQGSLHQRLFKKPSLTWRLKSKILIDICRGLAWLHSATPPIMHGDIKLRNILLDENLRAKLGDFGFSQEIPQLIAGRSVITVPMVSRSAGYTAPETEYAHVSVKTDMYSYGVVALELFTKKVAHDKKRDDPKLTEHYDEERRSLEGYRSIADDSADDIAPNLLQLYYKIIEQCLLKHSKRCSSDQVMEWWSETNF
ncbi:uncharacterized protein [Dysidea avara]|uniref:uncharacterized protein isoform X2 n=1 Tax=Dysidea avara TaxID=196820 RepID=UPI0033294D53